MILIGASQIASCALAYDEQEGDESIITCVSKNSNVLGMSRIDLAPAQTTATGLLLNSVRSLEMSRLLSAPR